MLLHAFALFIASAFKHRKNIFAMTIQTEKSGSYICKGNVNAIENRAAVLTRNQF